MICERRFSLNRFYGSAHVFSQVASATVTKTRRGADSCLENRFPDGDGEVKCEPYGTWMLRPLGIYTQLFEAEDHSAAMVSLAAMRNRKP